MKKEDNDQFILTHIHAQNWADNTAPPVKNEFNALNYLIYRIKSLRKKSLETKVVVHCSAGIGRTGTFISLYNIVTLVEALIRKHHNGDPAEPEVPIFGVVRRLREQRWGMINCQE